MTSDELAVVVAETIASLQSLLAVKGGEYANSDDRLANFKRGAALVGLQPLQTWFIYVSKHYDSVASYVKKTAKGETLVLSEPIEGRLDDIIVYCTLAKALIKEARGADPAVELDRERSKHDSGVCGKRGADLLRPPAFRASSVSGDGVGGYYDVYGVEPIAGVRPAEDVQPSLDSPVGGRLTTKVSYRPACIGCHYEDLLPISWPCCNCFNADRRI